MQNNKQGASQAGSARGVANNKTSQQAVDALAEAMLKAVNTVVGKLEKRLQKIENGKIQNNIAIDSSKLGGKPPEYYLPADGTAVNASALGGKAPEYYLAPVNLLGNGYFINPINQRGQSSYTVANYTIDRWTLREGAGTGGISVSNNGVTINQTTSLIVFRQALEEHVSNYLIGKKITAAAKSSDGTIIVVTTTVPPLGVNLDTSEAFFPNGLGLDIYRHSSNRNIEIRFLAGITTAPITLEWAALYEGAYTAETLPPYVPKGYAAELAECQRYFQIIKSGYPVLGNAYSIGTDSAQMALQLERSMRYPPTVTIDDTKIGLTFNGVYLYATDATWQTDMSVFNPCMKATLTFANGSFPAIGYPCVPYLDADIYVSADL